MPDSGVEDNAGKGGVLLLWDDEGAPPAGDWTTVLWRQYAGAEDPSVISITQMVEQNADGLRARYLAWIYDLGEARIDGKRVIDHLSLRPGFSYWWMSSLAQKFNVSGTSLIDDAIKALALETLVFTRQSTGIVLISGNRQLADCIKKFCCRKNIKFELRKPRAIRTKGYVRSLFHSLPSLLRAFFHLSRSFVKVLPLSLGKKTIMPAAIGDVMFIDVLVHLNQRAISEGRFISNYWTELVDKLHEWGLKTNWLHLFFPHPTIPSFTQAQHQIHSFNTTSNGSQFHALVERSLSFHTLVTIVSDYFSVYRAYARLHDIHQNRPAGSDLDLWPLHADEWKDSLCGAAAMNNCLKLSFFVGGLRIFPTQRVGVYITENQPWEMALIYAWKAAGHGTLIGTPHTTVRYWDLRYHYDSRSYLQRNDNGLPLPDVLAVNGPAARESILSSGYPAESVTEVEALRYLHLAKPQAAYRGNSSGNKGLRVLVCGDFLEKTSRQLITWLEEAATSLSGETVFVFKPHPAFPFKFDADRGLRIKVSAAPLAKLLAECDLVFTSNITSAAVDAYCSGVSVIQMLDGSTFNTSPLQGRNGVTYVRNPSELADALRNFTRQEYLRNDPYFNFDENLTLWRKLLTSHKLRPV